jgi:RNA-directed DNA polymerase
MMQTKLHRWAAADPGRVDDLFSLVHDPATLIVAWQRVAGNTGARSPGVDGRAVADVEDAGVQEFLDDLRAQVKAGTFRPMPVRERMIPKPVGGGKVRRLGIPTVTAECPAFWRVFGCGADCSSVPCAVRPSGAGVVRQASWA